jgi:large subunit ribosomal protein L25
MYDQLTAQNRKTDSGPNPTKLRKSGFIPGILYGSEVESTPLQLSRDELVKTLNHGHHVFEIKLGQKTHLVNVGEIQRDPMSRKIIHISFLKLKENQKTTMAIPLHFVGEAKGSREGGVVTHPVNTLQVEGLPKNMPDSIEVDISELAMHEALHINEIKLPSGLSLKESNPEQVVVSCHPPKVEAAPEEPETPEESGETADAGGEKASAEGEHKKTDEPDAA